MKVSIVYPDVIVLTKVAELIKKHGLELSWVSKPDIIISIGGDGTVLNNYNGTPILPVRIDNTKSLGYMSDFSFAKVDEALKRLSEGKFTIEERIMLDVFRNRKKIGTAINEVTFLQSPVLDTYEAMRFSVKANRKQLFKYSTILGDGIIISTPNGSTGSNESANGVVLQDLTAKEIVITLRYPIGFNSWFDIKSKYLPSNTTITFKFYRPDDAFAIIDSDCIEIEKEEVFTVKESKDIFKVVKINGMEEDRVSKNNRRMKWLKQSFK